MSNKTKRSKNELDNETKSEICRYHRDNPGIKNVEIIRHFFNKFQIQIPPTTMSDILKKKDKYLNNDFQNQYRDKKAQHPDLEEALYLWFSDKRAFGLAISDEMLIEKAKDYGVLLGIEKFSYSSGWLSNFKQRHRISKKVLHGESASVDPSDIVKSREKLKTITSGYSLNDIYNFDETALFYKLQPNKTLSDRSENGKKKNKDRITIGICCNASGSDKILPVAIGKFKRPHCFKHSLPSDILPYYYNRTAWMTCIIFEDFLTKFNDHIKTLNSNRKVLLIVDNASSHSTQLEFSKVKVCFLPPNCTSVLQPCDLGIIYSFKSQYRKLLVKFFLNSIEMSNEIVLPNLKDALYMVRNAWNKVSRECIENCWHKSDITSLSIEPKPDVIVILYFINVDNEEPTGESLTDTDIIELVKKSSENESDENESEIVVREDEAMQVGFREAFEALNKFCLYIEQSCLVNDKDADCISYFKSRILDVKTLSLKQPSLFEFMSKN